MPPTPSETTPTDPKLPQTGQLWWPVILLGAAGVILVLVGFLWTKKNKDEEQ